MANCQHVKSQGELDHLLQMRDQGSEVCIHVDADAEESVLAWWEENKPEPEINGKW